MPSRRHFLQQATSGLAALALHSQALARAAARTYTNPVYAGQFPDPFVLRHQGRYYAFGTTGQGRTADGRIFTVLTSTNLVDWKPAGGALTPPQGATGADFWARK
ncbi:family 43 glycosylhydrolase [Hymenobacter cellulosilyticus]|uniref:Family 43 glycosylhydrolase n=1 Tax=Hymenobacter cellulosilyticus TaxID=2932248 RepID=A0A8T9Q4S5_9BACT|nr:family 43 glycosylhydrolase [Hymenobacter cellulosilyticus]UOQ71972.1 family 43 glycosylhydrolase [Hymenobacter cellulosilyticus]